MRQLKSQIMPCQIEPPENIIPSKATRSGVNYLHVSDIQKYHSKRMQKHSPHYIGKRTLPVAN